MPGKWKLYIPTNGTGSRKACCSYRLQMPSQAAYWEKNTTTTYGCDRYPELRFGELGKLG
jgi:hypothetical protein